MATTVRIEKRQRGLFGWVFLVLFWGFNALMAVGLFRGLADNAATIDTLTDDAQRAGAAIGTALGAGMVLTIWMAGAVILGLCVLLTRGRKIITETVKG